MLYVGDYMNSKKLAKEGLFVARRNPFTFAKTFYDSIEPPSISFEKALEILNSQEEWEKLNLGQKLNVVKVFSNEVAKELDIPPPPIHLADYRGLIKTSHSEGTPISIKDGFVLNMAHLKYAVNVRNAVAHEIKHIHQFYAIDDYELKTLPPKEIIEKWKNDSGKMSNGIIGSYVKNKFHDSTENDAYHFAREYSVKTFGEDKEIEDRVVQKIPIIRKNSIRKSMRYWKKRFKEKDLSGQGEFIKNEFDKMKKEIPEYSKEYEKLKKHLLKRTK